jgi:hypothetical protein
MLFSSSQKKRKDDLETPEKHEDKNNQQDKLQNLQKFVYSFEIVHGNLPAFGRKWKLLKIQYKNHLFQEICHLPWNSKNARNDATGGIEGNQLTDE